MTRRLIRITGPRSATIDVAAEIDGVERVLPLVRTIVADLDDAQAETVAARADVAWVEDDQQGGFSADWQSRDVGDAWQLDRIQKRSAADMDDTFRWRRTGDGVWVYIVDGGVNPHVEIVDRLDDGHTVVGGDPHVDDSSHGTGMATLAAGETVGVAPGATVVPVKISTSSSISSADVVDGLEWIVANHPDGTPAVANLSMQLSGSSTLDSAVEDLIAAGVPVTVAAGNGGDDTSGVSPARADGALTVAAANKDDSHRSDSNHGGEVDLYAPGEDVQVGQHTGNEDYGFWSATSVSSAIVCGIVALLLEAAPDLTPGLVHGIVPGQATDGAVSGVPSGTTDAYAYSLITVGDEDALPAYVWTGTHWALVDGPAADEGGGSVAVDDDGSEVVGEASRLNFGDGLSVTDEGSGEVTVDAASNGASGGGLRTAHGTVGDGSATEVEFDHGLSTPYVQVQVYDLSGSVPTLVWPDAIDVTGYDTVGLTFDSAPGEDERRVVVVGGGPLPKPGSGDVFVTGYEAAVYTPATEQTGDLFATGYENAEEPEPPPGDLFATGYEAAFRYPDPQQTGGLFATGYELAEEPEPPPGDLFATGYEAAVYAPDPQQTGGLFATGYENAEEP